MLDFDRVKKLHEEAVGNDKAEISLLHNAVLERMRAYQQAATAANLRDWQAAKTALAALVDKLWPRYVPGDAVATDPMRFDRQKDALAWLHAKGYKVSAGKFSNDWNGGKVRVLNGSVLFSDLLTYATRLDVDHKKVASADQRQAKKDEVELRILTARADREERSNKRENGALIDRTEAEMALARKLVIVYGRIRAQFRRDQDTMLLALGLPPAKASTLLIEAVGCLDRAFNAMRDHRVFDVLINEDEHADI